MFRKPSNDRDWQGDMKILPYAEIAERLITIHNVRNFRYRAVDDYSPAYYDKTFALDSVMSVDLIYVPFSRFPGMAHTFLSFGLSDNSYIAISIEIRKSRGQKYSSFKGLFNRFELVYMIGDERDLVKLRTDYRHEPVYIYPVKAPIEKIRALLLDMLVRANELRQKPEFYNTLTNTCTTNILRHYNAVASRKQRWSYHVLLPGYFDRLAFGLGLVATDLPRRQAKKRFYVNGKAIQCDDDENFSLRIRS